MWKKARYKTIFQGSGVDVKKSAFKLLSLNTKILTPEPSGIGPTISATIQGHKCEMQSKSLEILFMKRNDLKT